jgi:hypothetical protein
MSIKSVVTWKTRVPTLSESASQLSNKKFKEGERRKKARNEITICHNHALLQQG